MNMVKTSLPKMGIDEFYKYLTERFQYGFTANGHGHEFKSPSDDKFYRTSSIEEFENSFHGTCFDGAEYTYVYLRQYYQNCHPTLYYIELYTDESKEPMVTHAWASARPIVPLQVGKICSIEVAYYNHRGVNFFKSERDMLNSYIKWIEQDLEEDGKTVYGYTLYTYKPLIDISSHNTFYDYIKGVRVTGRMIDSWIMGG